MTLENLKHFLLVNTALDVAEDDIPVLKTMVMQVLPIYGNYRPLTLRDNFEISYTTKLNKDKFNRNIIGVKGLYFSTPELLDYQKLNFNWKFDNESKLLYSQIPGNFLIEYLAEPLLEDITEKDYLFLNMLIGKLKMYIASHRKQFTMDLPFQTDADTMYNEGLDLYEKAYKELTEDIGNWYKAIEI